MSLGLARLGASGCSLLWSLKRVLCSSLHSTSLQQQLVCVCLFVCHNGDRAGECSKDSRSTKYRKHEHACMRAYLVIIFWLIPSG
jgi:hypothetical protein